MTQTPITHVALVRAEGGASTEALVAELSELLAARRIRTSHVRNLAELQFAVDAAEPSMKDAHDISSLAIVIGNDRSVLRFARHLAQRGIPLLGVHQDRLGFLGALPPGEARASLHSILDGGLRVEFRAMLEARVRRSGSGAVSELALNDIVVAHSARSRLIDLRAEVDGERAFDLRADGVVISTPTGSTGYSLSAGGPVVHPGVPAWSLTPIAAHTLTNRPLVVPLGSTIRVTVMSAAGATVLADGLAAFDMGEGDFVELRLANVAARFIHPRDWSYFATLRQKLGWSLAP